METQMSEVEVTSKRRISDEDLKILQDNALAHHRCFFGPPKEPDPQLAAATDADSVTVRFVKDHKQFGKKAGDTQRMGIGMAKTLRSVGYVTFDEPEPVDKALEQPPQDKAIRSRSSVRTK